MEITQEDLDSADFTLAVVCPVCGETRVPQGVPDVDGSSLGAVREELLDEAYSFGWLPVRIGDRRAVVCGQDCARRWAGSGGGGWAGEYDDQTYSRLPYANVDRLRAAVEAMGAEEFRPKDVHDHPMLDGFDLSMARVYGLLRKMTESGWLVRRESPGHQGVYYRRAAAPVSASTPEAAATRELSGIPGAAGFRVLVTTISDIPNHVHHFRASISDRETGEVLYSDVFGSAVEARDALREEVPVLRRRIADGTAPGGA